MSMPLLIAGGLADPNLATLASAAQAFGIPVCDLRHGAGVGPTFTWRPEDDGAAWVDGELVQPRAAFIRHDVFGGMEDPRPEVAARALGWHQAVYGWVLSCPGVRVFNRTAGAVAGNKPATLALAQRAGLSVADVCVTNDEATLRRLVAGANIAKPVAGGDYCYPLDEVLDRVPIRDGRTAAPAIVQARLVSPEVRIYVIGRGEVAFELRSPSLDYRVRQDAEVIHLPEVPAEIAGLRRLMAAMGMDFGAADFKTDPITKKLSFLELNSSPMFARFDQVANGRIARLMIEELCGGSS